MKKIIKQIFCPHKEWNMDKQIRVIECTSCGKRSWVKGIVDLFTK